MVIDARVTQVWRGSAGTTGAWRGRRKGVAGTGRLCCAAWRTGQERLCSSADRASQDSGVVGRQKKRGLSGHGIAVRQIKDEARAFRRFGGGQGNLMPVQQVCAEASAGPDRLAAVFFLPGVNAVAEGEGEALLLAGQDSAFQPQVLPGLLAGQGTVKGQSALVGQSEQHQPEIAGRDRHLIGAFNGKMERNGFGTGFVRGATIQTS